jgi:hypothetical protein
MLLSPRAAPQHHESFKKKTTGMVQGSFMTDLLQQYIFKVTAEAIMGENNRINKDERRMIGV